MIAAIGRLARRAWYRLVLFRYGEKPIDAVQDLAPLLQKIYDDAGDDPEVRARARFHVSRAAEVLGVDLEESRDD